MKKLYNFLGIILVLSINTNSYSQCPSPSAYEILQGNNVNALIGAGQGMWQDESNNNAVYEVPAGSGTSVFYAGGFWISGKSQFNILHTAATRYNTVGHDFFSGPLTTDGSAEATNCIDYDRVFQITRLEVLTHLAYYNAVANGTDNIEFPQGYFIPQDILDYPAQGNVQLGEAANLAPFYDYDNDGVYNAYNGDCPLFTQMGVDVDCDSCDALMGDIAFFWINNDKGNVHSETGGEPFGIEIHNTAFAYTNPNAAPSKSTFYQKKIINRSTIDYHDVYVGIYVDADIGNAANDYTGCDIGRDLGYAYNGTVLDPTSDGVLGYGENPPAAGVTILKGPKAKSDNIDNDGDGTIDNENLGMTNFIYYRVMGTACEDPETSQDYYNYLSGFWTDGAPLTYGGNGHDSNTGVPTNHMFPDDFVLNGGDPWTEVIENNPPGDRRFLVSMGPFDMAAGEEICIVFAAVVGDVTTNMTSIENLKYKTDIIRNQFELCSNNGVGVPEIYYNQEAINWNTTTNELSVSSKTNNSFQLKVYNNMGQVVFEDNFQKNYIRQIQNLSAGVFVVKIVDENGIISTKKISFR